jgi:hypothetical protein
MVRTLLFAAVLTAGLGALATPARAAAGAAPDPDLAARAVLIPATPAPIPLATFGSAGGLDYTLSAAADGAGNIVVAWIRTGSAAGQSTVYMRRFNAKTRPLGPIVQITATAGGDHQFAAVAVSPRGAFVVAWETVVGQDIAIHAQRFAANGAKVGGDIVVNDDPGPLVNAESIGTDNAGNFVVAWHETGHGIFVRRFARGSGLQAQQQPVDDAGATFPAVAMQPNGTYALAWHPGPQAAAAVQAQQFDSAGEPAGDSFAVDSTFLAASPIVATATPDGGFAFAWNTVGCTGTTGITCQVRARRFDHEGQPGPDLMVEESVYTGVQSAIAVNADGDLVVSSLACAAGGTDCGISAVVYSPLSDLIAATQFGLVSVQDNGPAVVATGNGFLVIFDRYGPGQTPYGVYGVDLIFH